MKNENNNSNFSILIYILVIFSFSWPFGLLGAFWASDIWQVYTLNSIAMLMVTVGTVICGKYVFKDGFANSGWRWGKPVHYAAAIGWVLFIWFLPTVIDLLTGYNPSPDFSWNQMIIMIVGLTLLSIIPGFGEEFGWRGYMLPHLASSMTPRKAVLSHNFIWWAWHIPMLLSTWIITVKYAGYGTLAISIFLSALVTLIGQGSIFAYVWTKSQSLSVSSVFHGTNNGVRDGITLTAGLSPLTSLFTSLFILVGGALLLWKGNWKNLEKDKKSSE